MAQAYAGSTPVDHPDHRLQGPWLPSGIETIVPLLLLLHRPSGEKAPGSRLGLKPKRLIRGMDAASAAKRLLVPVWD